MFSLVGVLMELITAVVGKKYVDKNLASRRSSQMEERRIGLGQQ